MFYDILHDDVVIKNYNGLPLILDKRKGPFINFSGHQFVRVVSDSSNTDFKISGFYDVLFDGEAKAVS
jgi:hypothetical protein